MVEIFIKFELQKIRKEFREFYGHLPIEELAKNLKLIQKIQKLEEQLRGLLDADFRRLTDHNPVGLTEGVSWQ